MLLRSLVLSLALLTPARPSAIPPPSTEWYPVTYHGCYDGDTCTFDVHIGFDLTLRRQRVRLCDINAPEIRPRATRAAGLAARDLLDLHIRTSTTVRLGVPHALGQPLRDNFGRLLGYVYADGINLNQVMLDAGAATPYPRKCAPTPP